VEKKGGGIMAPDISWQEYEYDLKNAHVKVVREILYEEEEEDFD
jgi:hypothetical protein